ncbi:hypothetical protein GH714_020525 [Hevea brasiliensis]|uniref:Pentacotripeptide-repeat region of PRORP domain-containing protein n=1 Tax=Hevea brasiliensis TaxID=3981 RepID=A0A6A6KRM0_HEVBR|nr:hypothetical protein GH714_020525 [Hevea brasiliensis]
MMRKMSKAGLSPAAVTYGALVRAYCLNGNVYKAMKVLIDMDAASKVPPNTEMYNILIDSLCKNNDVELAVSLIDGMKVKGVRPNMTTYNAIFKGLREKKSLKPAFELMDKMREQTCNPDYITMEILTEWLSPVGEANRVLVFQPYICQCAMDDSFFERSSSSKEVAGDEQVGLASGEGLLESLAATVCGVVDFWRVLPASEFRWVGAGWLCSPV